MKDGNQKKKIIIGVVIAAVVIALFGVGVSLFDRTVNAENTVESSETVNAGSSESKKAKKKNSNEDIGTQTLYIGDNEYEITHNIETYLLIGTDDSGNVEAEGTKEYRGRMADFLLLLVLDRTENTYGFLQINRDTMTDVPFMDTEGNGQDAAYEQICIANWYGGTPEMGCSNTVFTVGELLGGVNIDGYYSINMKDIGTLNHAVGGVEVTLEEDFSSADPEMTKGKTLVLSDKQAEIFVRGRMSVGDGKNTSRMHRQQQYMHGFKSRAFAKMKNDSSFVNDLVEMLEDSAVTDVPNNRISVIANQLYKNTDLGILQFEGEDKEGDTLGDGLVHAEFYADEESIADAMVKLCNIDEEHIIRYDEEGNIK